MPHKGVVRGQKRKLNRNRYDFAYLYGITTLSVRKGRPDLFPPIIPKAEVKRTTS